MPQDVSMLYKSVISERKAMLMLQLTLMAKKSRISAPKLQKALVGISRICESHLATYKVLKHYHSRIASGKQDLQSQRKKNHNRTRKRISMREKEESVDFRNPWFSSNHQTLLFKTILIPEVNFWELQIHHYEVFPCSFNHEQRIVAAQETRRKGHLVRFGYKVQVWGRLQSQQQCHRCRDCLPDPPECQELNLLNCSETIERPNNSDYFALQLEDSILRGLKNLFPEYKAILERAITSATANR
uniref:Uncharacterized protein n=1 Tax=Populus trichocarpa TaxID=3694 RepID=B9GRF7_POPTR